MRKSTRYITIHAMLRDYMAATTSFNKSLWHHVRWHPANSIKACKCQFPWTTPINNVSHDAAQNISMPNPSQRCSKSFCKILSNELLQPFRFSFDIYYKKAINMEK